MKKKAKEKELEIIVNNFNNSPWISFGSPIDFESSLKRAKKIGFEKVFKEINRADLNLFHKEEAACGNI